MSDWLQLRSDWPWHNVADLQAKGVILVEDGNHGEYRPRPSEFSAEGTPFLRAADLEAGRPQFATAGKINETAFDRIRKGVGAPGDILFSHKGTVGKVARAPIDAPSYVCSPQTTFWRILSPDVLDPDFLYVYMRSPDFIRQWTARKGDTDMADYVSLTAQRTLLAPIPPLRLQRKIGAAVRAFDDLIENNNRRIKILEEMAQRIYREWFVDFRYPGHEDVPLQMSKLGPIPDGWTVDTVGATCALERNSFNPGEKPDVPIDLFSFAAFDGDKLPIPTPGREIKSSKFMLKYPCILLAKLNPRIPRVWYATPREGVRTGASTEFMVLSARPGWPLSYCLSMLSDSTVYPSIVAGAVGTSTSHQRAQSDQVMQIEVAIPPSQFREQFDQIVDPMFLLINTLRRSTARLKQSRDLLLPRLISGEIDVDHLNIPVDEAAA